MAPTISDTGVSGLPRNGGGWANRYPFAAGGTFIDGPWAAS